MANGLGQHNETAIAYGGELPPLAARMYAIVKKPHPGELKWQEIPWLVDLDEGIRVAKEEKRPLLLWTADDAPLERC